MKKFYAFAAVAALALSANAQLYVCGQGDGLAWSPEAPLEVALANGAYTFDVANLAQFKISTTFGDWDTFNGGAKTAIVNEADLGTAVALTDGDANIMCPWEGDYHIVVAGDLSTITMTTTTPNPGGFKAMFVRGGMNGWGSPDDWKMETDDGINYWFDCTGDHTIALGEEFKLADSGWAQINYGAAGEVYADEEFPISFMYNAGNSVMGEDNYAGTIHAVLTEIGAALIDVYFYPTVVPHQAGVSAVVVENEAAAVYYNLQGVEVANPANGLYIVRRGDKVSKVLVK